MPERHLIAIMFTDIVGYTAMMGKDEKRALKILQQNRTMQQRVVKKYHGQFLKEIGDGTLSSFHSTIEAVSCAVEIQKNLSRSSDYQIRIGIHAGDVVFEKGDIFGDGVNISSRIEPLAEPGGICITEQVYETLRNKPEIKAVYIGEKKLKNVDHLIKVYTLAGEGLPAPSEKAIIDETVETSRTSSLKRRIVLFSSIALLIAAAIAGSILLSRPSGEKAPGRELEKIDSIAVLPF